MRPSSLSVEMVCVDFVSYTHLDVYKRQEEKFPTELEARKAHEAVLAESRKQNRLTPTEVEDF